MSNRKNVLLRWAMAFLGPAMFAGLRALPRYVTDWHDYKKRSHSETVAFRDSYPCLTDRVKATPFDPHYFYQAAWLARKLEAASPRFHVDIGSSVASISVLSAHVPTVFLDFRPLRVRLSNLESVAADITRLPLGDRSIKSLSCLHVIEHVGLGRYGDALDPGGSRKAAAELQRVLAPGGTLYLSLPVGLERVCFNAHRVHAAESVIRYLHELELVSFSLVDDRGHFRGDVSPDQASGLNYGCGLFEFRRVDQQAVV